MTTPIRILRAKAQARNPAHFALTERQRVRQESILDIAKHLIADEGRENITFAGLARALRLAVTTLAFHFVDLEALLGEIIRRHLRALSSELGKISADDPLRHKKRRAAYVAYTRTPMGGLNEAHLLLVRDRHTLPPDERETIELIRYGIGELLTDGSVEDVFLFLDAPLLTPARIEAYIAGHAPEPPPQPEAPTFDTLTFDTIDPEATHERPGDWALSYGGLTTVRAPAHAALTGIRPARAPCALAADG
jgi:AcrR family transcriptional regulator